jgi:hypothetical protein
MRLQREVGDESAKQYRTAYLLAAEDSEHKLCQTYRTYDVQILAGEAAGASLNPKQVQRSEQLRQRDQQEDGVLGLLHQRLREYILGDVMGVGYGDDYRRRVAQGGLPALSSPVLRVHNSAVLAADMVWSSKSFDLQPVRAHPDCFGAPWFDCVAVRMLQGTSRSRGRGGAEAELQYAQLLLLFRAQLPLENFPSCTEWEGLAYVRWFSVEPTRGNVLSQYKVLKRDQALGLSWESSAQVNSCGIIPLSSIVRRVHIVPAFERGTAVVKSGSYHLNPFKY